MEPEVDTVGGCMRFNQEWESELFVEITLAKIDSNVIDVGKHKTIPLFHTEANKSFPHLCCKYRR